VIALRKHFERVETCFARKSRKPLMFQRHTEPVSLTYVFYFATSCLTRDFVLTRSGTTDMRACTRECKTCYALRFFHTIYFNGRICM